MNRSNILLIETDADLQETLTQVLHAQGHHVLIAADGDNAADILEQINIDLVLADVDAAKLRRVALLDWLKARRMSPPVILMAADGGVRDAITAIRAGACDYFVKPLDVAELSQAVARYAMCGHNNKMPLIAVDDVSLKLLNLTRRVAATDVAVMIGGPSGSGKEVIAQYIHRYSERCEAPFVAINCAAIPDNMLEAMLFGYEKGAFTGAYQAMPGKFEQAQGGTLLLDEISEMDLALQAKILRVLQEKEVERVGGRKQVHLDLRVIATTNRRLKEEVAAGRFREDLYYRLNVFPLFVQPLCQRLDDILPLAMHFLHQYKQKQMVLPDFSEDAKQAMLSYPWPGNVRELENVMQRALILKRDDCITLQDLHFEEGDPSDTVHVQADCLSAGLKSTEEQMIVEVLNTKNITRRAAAEQLGISQRTLRYKIAKLRDSGIAIPG